MMGLLIYKYESLWQEVSVKSLILSRPLRPVGLLFFLQLSRKGEGWNLSRVLRTRQPLDDGLRQKYLGPRGETALLHLAVSPCQNTCIRADTLLGIRYRSLTAQRPYLPCNCLNTYPAFKNNSISDILLFNTKLMHLYLHNIDFILVAEIHNAKLRKWQIYF